MEIYKDTTTDLLILDNEVEEWRYFELYDVFISSFGRVKRPQRIKAHNYGGKKTIKQRFKEQTLAKSGYLSVFLINDKLKKHFRVNRLVAMLFHENPENKPCVNHKNGIKTDNRAINLEWCTARENTRHAFDNGLMNPHFGENNGMARLSNKNVMDIKYAYALGVRPEQIVKVFNISKSYCIHLGRDRTMWANIQPEIKTGNINSAELDEMFFSHKKTDTVSNVYFAIVYLTANKQDRFCQTKDIKKHLGINAINNAISVLLNMGLIYVISSDKITNPKSIYLQKQQPTK